MNVAVGVDLGGTNTILGVVNSQGDILFKKTVSTNQFKQPDDWVNWVAQTINEYRLDNAEYLIEGVGIGAPNGNIRTGHIVFAPNLIWQGEVPLADMVKRATKLPVVLTNDANAAALGEMLFGVARGLKDFLYITLGTGLGSGVVCNGEMVYGHDGFAGEVGHMTLIPGGRLCACGRFGCVEAYCSATAIRQTYLDCAGSHSSIDAKVISEWARAGDEAAKLAFSQTGEWLGLALANCVAVTSPEKIILFGGLAQAGDLLLEPTRKSFEINLLKIYRNKIPIIFSQLSDNDAAILGAATLIFIQKGN